MKQIFFSMVFASFVGNTVYKRLCKMSSLLVQRKRNKRSLLQRKNCKECHQETQICLHYVNSWTKKKKRKKKKNKQNKQTKQQQQKKTTTKKKQNKYPKEVLEFQLLNFTNLDVTLPSFGFLQCTNKKQKHFKD